MHSSAETRGWSLRAFTTAGIAAVVFTSWLTPSVAAPAPDEVADAQTAEKVAAKSGKSVVISSETTESSEVRANPDGSRTLVEHALPVRVKQNGTWTAVDLTLERRDDGTVAPKAAPVTMVFTAGGPGSAQRGPVARLVKDSTEVGFGWDVDLPPVQLNGSTATYREILPGVDMELQASHRGFSQALVVKTAAAARNPKLKKITFRSHTRNVTISKSSSTSTAAASGPRSENLVVTNSAGEQVFTGDASTMWDSSSDARRALMGVEVGRDTVSITPDQAFLNDAKTTYPVRLDPDYYCTTCTKAHHAVVQSPPEWVDARNYDVTSGQLSDLKAGYLNAASLGASRAGVSRTYIAMNTHSLHSRTIHWATLKTRVINTHSCSPTPTELWMTNGIDPNTTWNNQPAWWWSTGENNVSNNPGHCQSNGDAEFDATRAVRHIAATNQSYLTLMLKAKDEGSLNASWRRFDLNPYLEVHYNTLPSKPTDLGIEGWGGNGADALPCRIGDDRPAVFTRTPRLRARLSDLDGGLLDAAFRLYKGTHNNYTWNGKEIHQGEVPSGSFSERSVTDGWITEDGIYSWNLWAGDYESSTWSDVCEFEVDSVAPNKPAVSSTDYPVSGFNGSVGRTGNFTFTPNGNTGRDGRMDVQRYGWSLNVDTVGTRVDVTSADGKVTVPITPVQSGTNTLYVYAFDRAGNRAPEPARYVFNVAEAAGPVGTWKLDETGGTTAGDSSGRNHPLSLTGGAAFGAGYAANGLLVNGTTAHAVASGPVVDTSRAFSVSAWAKLDNTNSWATVASQDGQHASAFLLEYSKEYDRWTFSASGSDVDNAHVARATSAAPPQLGVWTHLLGTYEPNSRKLSVYVNGKLEGTNEIATWNAGGSFVTGAGKWDSRRGSFFPGAVDHVQVWDRVLNAGEAARQNNFAVLRAHYLLDEQSGGTARDAATGQNAALAGGVRWGAKPGDPDDPDHVPTSEEKWLNYDSSSTGEVTAPRPVNLRTDRSYTVSAWVRQAADGGSRIAVGMADGKFSPFQLGYRPESKRWGLFVTESPVDGKARLALSNDEAQTNRWVHLAGSYDAVTGSITLYVNGVPQNRFENTNGKDVPTFNGTGPLLLGRGVWDGQRAGWWKGDLDDVRVYSGALTPGDIDQLHELTRHF